MKKILISTFLFFISLTYAQKLKDEKYIYDFMSEIIIQQKLDLKNGLETELEKSASESLNDDDFLKSLLIDNKDINEGKDIMKDTFYYSYPEKCLTQKEINSMLNSKKKLKDFKWDNSFLGFRKENKKNKYSFSLPLFSSDRTKAIIMIKYTCPGLCGSAQTILFKKENGNWGSHIVAAWWY